MYNRLLKIIRKRFFKHGIAACLLLVFLGSYSEKIDVFSFGVVLWEMCHRTPPYLGVEPDKVSDTSRGGRGYAT